MSKFWIKAGTFSVLGLFASGCVVYERPRPVVTEAVVVGPGVEVVEVEPAPEDRVYVYDEGYPPGVYFCGGFYWYGGQRYEHDVFVRDVVVVNIREGRYRNVEENRRQGQQIEAQHRQAYAVNHGRANSGRPEVSDTRTQPRTGAAGGQSTASRGQTSKTDKKPKIGGAQASARD
jgi:hypothetical protein